MNSENNDIHIKSSKKKGEKHVSITLENDLTIYIVEELKEKIIESYKKHDLIDFKLKNIKNIDLTFIQLFFSLQQASHKEGKTIAFDIDFPDDLDLLFSNSDIKKVFR
jgi:MFS superfamily sulfate permease-like transporter